MNDNATVVVVVARIKFGKSSCYFGEKYQYLFLRSCNSIYFRTTFGKKQSINIGIGSK